MIVEKSTKSEFIRGLKELINYIRKQEEDEKYSELNNNLESLYEKLQANDLLEMFNETLKSQNDNLLIIVLFKMMLEKFNDEKRSLNINKEQINSILSSIINELKENHEYLKNNNIEIFNWIKLTLIAIHEYNLPVDKNYINEFIDIIIKNYKEVSEDYKRDFLRYMISPALLLYIDKDLFNKITGIFDKESIVTSILSVDMKNYKIYEMLEFFGSLSIKLEIKSDIIFENSKFIDYLIQNPKSIKNYQDIVVPVLLLFYLNNDYRKGEILSIISKIFDKLSNMNKFYSIMINVFEPYNKVDSIHLIDELYNVIDDNKLNCELFKEIENKRIKIIEIIDNKKIQKLNKTKLIYLSKFLISSIIGNRIIEQDQLPIIFKVLSIFNLSIKDIPFLLSNININIFSFSIDDLEEFKRLPNKKELLEFIYNKINLTNKEIKIQYILIYSYVTGELPYNLLNNVTINDIIEFAKKHELFLFFISKNFCETVIKNLLNKEDLNYNDIKILSLFYNKIESHLGTKAFFKLSFKIKKVLDDFTFIKLFLPEVNEVIILRNIYVYKYLKNIYGDLLDKTYKKVKNMSKNEEIFNKNHELFKVVENLVITSPLKLAKGMDKNTYKKLKYLVLYYYSVSSAENMFFKYLFQNFEQHEKMFKTIPLSSLLDKENIVNEIINQILNPDFNTNLKEYVMENLSILEMFKYIKNNDLKNKIINKCISRFYFKLPYNDINLSILKYIINSLFMDYSDFLSMILKEHKTLLDNDEFSSIIKSILDKLLSSTYLFYKNQKIIKKTFESLVFYSNFTLSEDHTLIEKYVQQMGEVTPECLAAIYIAINKEKGSIDSISRYLKNKKIKNIVKSFFIDETDFDNDMLIEIKHNSLFILIKYFLENIDKFSEKEDIKDRIVILINSYYSIIKNRKIVKENMLKEYELIKLILNNKDKLEELIFSSEFSDQLFLKMINEVKSKNEILELIYFFTKFLNDSTGFLDPDLDLYKINIFIENKIKETKSPILNSLVKIFKNPTLITRMIRDNYKFKIGLNTNNNNTKLNINIEYKDNDVRYSILTIICEYAKKNIEKLTGEKIEKITDIVDKDLISKYPDILKDPLIHTAYLYTCTGQVIHNTLISIISSENKLDILIDDKPISYFCDKLEDNYKEFFNSLAAYILPLTQNIDQYIIDNIENLINKTSKKHYDYENMDSYSISRVARIIRFGLITHLNCTSLIVSPIINNYYLQFIVPNTKVCYCIVCTPETITIKEGVTITRPVRPNSVWEFFENARVFRIIKITKSRKGFSFSVLESIDDFQKDLIKILENNEREDVLASLKLKQMGIAT